MIVEELTSKELEKFESERAGMFHARVPKKLRSQFRNSCEDAGRTMQDRLIELLEKGMHLAALPEPKHKEKEVILHVRSIPPNLKQGFKAYCNLRYMSLEDGLVSLIEMDLDGKIK